MPFANVHLSERCPSSDLRPRSHTRKELAACEVKVAAPDLVSTAEATTRTHTAASGAAASQSAVSRIPFGKLRACRFSVPAACLSRKSRNKKNGTAEAVPLDRSKIEVRV